eukprot:752198-Hanusia_phi.AAC.2
MVGEGGGRKLERLRSVESFACTEEGTSPLVAQWRKEPEMLEARSGLAVAELNGFLYAVGGNDGRQRLRSGERLDGREEGGGGWMGISPMLEARSNSALVAVGEKLFVMGGFDGRKRLTSMEVYDVKQNAWRSCASMRNAREGLAAVVVRRGAKGEGKDIFAIGGFDGERVLRSVERYVVEEDRWEEAEAMTRPRAFLGAFASGGRVFACGASKCCRPPPPPPPRPPGLLSLLCSSLPHAAASRPAASESGGGTRGTIQAIAAGADGVVKKPTRRREDELAVTRKQKGEGGEGRGGRPVGFSTSL